MTGAVLSWALSNLHKNTPIFFVIFSDLQNMYTAVNFVKPLTETI